MRAKSFVVEAFAAGLVLATSIDCSRGASQAATGSGGAATGSGSTSGSTAGVGGGGTGGTADAGGTGGAAGTGGGTSDPDPPHLPYDPAGWTVFPSDYAVTIYVDSVAGSDANPGTSPTAPIKTLAQVSKVVSARTVGQTMRVELKRG